MMFSVVVFGSSNMASPDRRPGSTGAEYPGFLPCGFGAAAPSCAGLAGTGLGVSGRPVLGRGWREKRGFLRGCRGVKGEPLPGAWKTAVPVPASDLAGRKIIFVVTEDWFFASHFLPMARAAREIGLEVAVVARVRDHRAAIEATGARVIPLEAERRSLNPMAAGYAAGQLAAALRDKRPALVHCIALRSILIGGA